MANVVEHRKYSLTNLGNNNNKFWNVTLFDNDDVHSEWGRQGDGQKSGQQKTWHGVGRSFMTKKIREKEKKGYRENLTVETEDNSPTATANVQSSKLKDIALKQIKSTSKLVQDLVDYLVKVNAHQIYTATGGKITYDTSTATFKTTQGVVIPAQVARARVLLSGISDMVNNSDFDFETDLNEYLSLIPRDFGRRRVSCSDILPDLTTVQRENDILDSLEASFAGVTTAPKKKTKKKKDDTPEIFKVELEIVEDKKIISWVRNLYQSTRKSMHRSNNLSIKTVYKIDIESMRKSFESYGKKLPDIRQLWHGTKASNLLSIMRQGLVIPPSSSGHCTGRMYGNGLYFSSISTKALNYATNYWGGGGSTDRTFMFLADVAMGKYHLAGGGWGSFPVRGTDSTWAKGGQSGVINDEMIVYKLSQANLIYLVEFCPRNRY
jgi:poly [ADP-ribose] polymerase